MIFTSYILVSADGTPNCCSSFNWELYIFTMRVIKEAL